VLRSHLIQLLEGFEEYRAGRRTDAGHPIHNLLVKELPEELRNLTPDAQLYKFDGSDGAGMITAVPWVAIFHREVTGSARTGYYVVFLVPEDRRSVVLELGLGATQFADLYGENRRALEASKIASQKVLGVARPIIAKVLSKDLQSRLVEGEISAMGATYEQKAYGKAAILSIRYQLEDLPSEDRLVSDYLEFVDFYRHLVESPLTPSTDDLVVGEVIDTCVGEEIYPSITEVCDYESPQRPGSRGRGVGSGVSGFPRYSRASKSIGDLGERLVLDYLRRRLKDGGRPDLAERVIWHQKSDVNRTPGWDITTYDLDTEEEILVEVKATQSAVFTDFILTRNEWRAAQQFGKKYWIFLLSNVLQQHPRVEILRNPSQSVQDGLISMEEASWQFRV